MSIIRLIAWRFMLKGTEKGRFSPMTLFAWLAIGVGVWAMGSLLSVMYGFESTLKERVLKAYPHVMIKPKDANAHIPDYAGWTQKLKAIDGTVRVVPYLESEMIVQSNRRTLGVVVWGMPASELAALKSDTEGALPAVNARVPEGLLGSELAHRVGADVTSTIKLISPTEKSGPMGLVPRAETFTVSGLYTSGHYDFDQQYIFLLLEDAQDLLKSGDAISGWHVWGKSVEDSDRLQKKIAQMLPGNLEAQSFSVFNAALFQSLKLEQYAMFTILCFAIAIAVMNIVITLVMHVSHKRRNIGVLRALGASKKQIRQIFIWQGAFLGSIGLLIGGVLTIGFLIYLKYFSKFLLPDIYYDRSIPVEVRPLSLALIYLVAIAMIYLSTLYPASRAAKLDPIEAIRE